MVTIILTILASLMGAVAYRLGGVGDPYDTKYRDFGVPAVALGTAFALGVRAPWWCFLLTFVLFFASLTTYWDTITRLWRGDESEYWENWLLTGFFYGLSFLPIAWATGEWLGFGIRVVVLALTTMLWSELISEPTLEEGGRGFLCITTLPLLLI